MIVLDASVLIDYLLDNELSDLAKDRLLENEGAIAAPHLIDIEVAQVIRRFVKSNQLTSKRAKEAIEDLSVFPALRYSHTSFLSRIYALRDNFTAYDATYLALAEALDCSLLTRDKAFEAYRGSARVEIV